MKFAHCLRTVNAIGKYTNTYFWGGGDFEVGLGYHWESLPWGGKFLGMSFPGEILQQIIS